MTQVWEALMQATKLPKLLLLLCAMTAFASHVNATELRGRVDGTHPYAPYPFPLNGARVDLYMPSTQGPRWIANAYTGGDGMYYFFGIQPGFYTLQVNGALNFPLNVVPVPQQDIQPILLR